jgi:hypothetical protein
MIFVGLFRRFRSPKGEPARGAETRTSRPAPVDRRQGLVDAMKWQDARRCRSHIWRPSSAGYHCGWCGVSQDLWDEVRRSSAAERMAEAHRYPAGPLRGARRQSRRGWSPGPP